MKKKALITGISGQDGSYLAELLLSKGYAVHGTVRQVAVEDPEHRLQRLAPIVNKITLHPASMESFASIYDVVDKVRPDECYHLAAKSYVSYSFNNEFTTIDTNINGTHNILSALKRMSPECRFYFAASSEMFGEARISPQNEETAFNPRSPYGISKVAGYYLTRNYRDIHGIKACSGILFNHKSPRRGFEFVTRKITSSAAKIKIGMEKEIHLGNIEARRDWGHASDYVNAMWLMLQQDDMEDYVIATGESHSVADFLNLAFSHLGLDYREYLIVDGSLYRPSEKVILRGDAAKAKKKLNWKNTINLEQLIQEMVDHDLKYYRQH